MIDTNRYKQSDLSSRLFVTQYKQSDLSSCLFVTLITQQLVFKWVFFFLQKCFRSEALSTTPLQKQFM